MPQPQEWTFNSHRVRFESSNVLVATLRGWITEDDARRLVDITRESAAAQPIYFVVDMQPMEGFPYPRLSQEGRQYIARNGNSDWFEALLIVGGGILQNITAKGLSLALLLSGKRRFDTINLNRMEDVWPWIERHRLGRARPASQG